MADTHKRAKVCTKFYILPDGSESRSAKANAKSLEFRFANGHTHAVKREDHPDNIRACHEWFGISEKRGNAFAGAKGDADAAEELFLSMDEQLRAGTWVERAEGVGVRPSFVVDAVVKALTTTGQKVDEKRLASIKETLKEKKARDGALKDPAIAAAYATLKAERAIAKAKVAAENAGTAKVAMEF